MFWLESDHLTVFTTSSHLAILTKSIIKFTLIFSKQLWDVWASGYIVFKRILVLNISIETQASRICLARLQGSLQYVCLKYFRALVTAKKLTATFGVFRKMCPSTKEQPWARRILRDNPELLIHVMCQQLILLTINFEMFYFAFV